MNSQKICTTMISALCNKVNKSDARDEIQDYYCHIFCHKGGCRFGFIPFLTWEQTCKR